MTTLKQSTITKQVSFTERLMDKADVRAYDLGVSFPEYLRQLVVADTRDLYKDILLTRPANLSNGAVARYKNDILEFYTNEAKNPVRGAKTVEEFMSDLEDEGN